MLQLKNSTPFAASATVFANAAGVDTLYVSVKASFSLTKEGWILSEEQVELNAEDIYHGDAASSSLKSPSDMHTGKPGTDVIVIGNAYAPAGTSVQAMDVRLAFAEKQKILRVFGDRTWQKGKISSPEPFTEMPIVFERAFGGGPEHKVNELNPVGTGYAGGRDAAEMEGVPLPNIESPHQLVASVKDEPEPVGYAAIAPHWLPRRSLAGTYDQQWQQTRAPFLPHDFDSRFCQSAPSDQVCGTYLQGGEPFLIEGMHPGGQLRFSLPSVGLVSKIELKSRTEVAAFNMETVLVQPNDLKINLVWRAAVACGKQVSNIGNIFIQMQR
ncbi:hypothetical protein SAMN02745866_01921 [Alteromonadaceae bacterium Bs31]|nr:hypothetical protein SAMN02745866_01921 [Alteromonadaceae bacterium Bs31]